MEDKINIIFLDVDGVLNCSTTRDRCDAYIGIEDKKVKLLKEIVDKTNSKIVLISTWKYFWYKNPSLKYREDHLARYLDMKLKKQKLTILDKTGESDSCSRSVEIIDYLDELKHAGIKVDNYIIIDDHMFDYRKYKLVDHLIKTSISRGGLTNKHVDLAVNKLLGA